MSRSGLVLYVLRIAGPLPFHIRSVRVLVDPKLIALLGTPFELTKVCFEKPLRPVSPHMFGLFPMNPQHFPGIFVLRLARSSVLASSLSCYLEGTSGFTS